MGEDKMRSFLQTPPSVASLHFHHRPVGLTPEYRVEGRWSLNLYGFTGRIRFPETGGDHPLRRGTICLMPPGTRRQFAIDKTGAHRVAHFRRAPSRELEGMMPVLLDSGATRPRLEGFFDEALAASNDARRSCLIWHVLWLIHDQQTAAAKTGSPVHPAVAQAVAWIQQHLAETFDVRDVAAISGVSHNQLIRHFRAAYGSTIVGYIRERRMELARELLIHSDLQLKAVAAEVGIPDPQAFNKTVRRHFGLSPSALRRAGNTS